MGFYNRFFNLLDDLISDNFAGIGVHGFVEGIRHDEHVLHPRRGSFEIHLHAARIAKIFHPDVTGEAR